MSIVAMAGTLRLLPPPLHWASSEDGVVYSGLADLAATSQRGFWQGGVGLQPGRSARWEGGDRV